VGSSLVALASAADESDAPTSNMANAKYLKRVNVLIHNLQFHRPALLPASHYSGLRQATRQDAFWLK